MAVTDLLRGEFTHLDLGVAHVGRVSSLSNSQSFQKFLNRSGAISVYRTVCMTFCARCSSAKVGASCPSLGHRVR